MYVQILNTTFLSYKFFGNSIKDYLLAIIIFIALLIIFKIIQVFVLKYFEKLALKTKTDIDDAFIEIVRTIRPNFYSFIAFYLAINFLSFNNLVKKIIDIILITWVVYQTIVAIQILIDYVIKKKISKEEKSANSAIITMGKILKATLWTLGGLLVLSNLGVDISSLIAGLGIGGIAVALALQNILSDLFSSFAIYFDKPFVIGDFIVVDKIMGTVEKIGIKTTRIRALQGEEIVVPNKELVSDRIQNFKKMQQRRIIFHFGVVYNTKTEKLKQIPKVIENIIKSIELTNFDRAHFYKFDDSALSFEVAYYVQSPDYNKFMDIQQEINYKIKEQFEERNISMAYPTQTIYLEQKM